MRYILIDREGAEKKFSIDQRSVDNKIFEYKISLDNQPKVFFIKKLAGKHFISTDKIKWSKVPRFKNLDELVSHASNFRVFRGFRPSGIGGKNEAALVAQMPGKVVKIFCKVGEQVKSGQKLLILEAMKMENEIKANRDGEIINLYVQEGQAIESGQPLVELSK